MLPFLSPPFRYGITPNRLPGLSAWYSADFGVLNSIGPDVPATDGQTVRRWLDKSGNGNHIEQSTLANQPTFQSGGGGNGTPAIDFNGTSARLVSPAGITLSTPLVMFAVWKSDTLTNGATRVFDSTLARVYFATGSGSFLTGNTEGGATLAATNTIWNAVTFRFDGVTNGGYLGSTQYGGGTSGGSGPSGNRVIGANNNQLAFHDGQIAEVAYYTSGLSDFDMIRLMRYAAKRYGVAAP